MTHRVLIVEDEKPLREAFAFLLETEGYNVSLAENGQAGLELLSSFKPDLILLDMLMPVMNGLEFLKSSKEKLRRKSGPKVLLLSNLSDPITIENAHVYGVDKMILKADLSPAELAGVIKEMLLTK